MFRITSLKKRIEQLENDNKLQSNNIRKLDTIINRLFKVGEYVYVELDNKFVKVKIQSIDTIANRDEYCSRHLLFPYNYNSYIVEVHYHNYYTFGESGSFREVESNLYSEEMFKEICKCKDSKKK